MKKLLFLWLGIAPALAAGCSTEAPYLRLTGAALGTTYTVAYDAADTLQREVEQLMQRVEKSLSVYDKESIISKVNRNEDVVLDDYFMECFEVAQLVSRQTNGAFDAGASPLFDAWGFGAKEHSVPPAQQKIDSLKQFCGMDKFSVVNNRLVKSDARAQLNANAVAKGYAVDVVARFLESRNITSYLVEIGGEIRCGGLKPNGDEWIVGIDMPKDGSWTPGAAMASAIAVSDRALATSGNYRRFYVSNNEKIPHTINPATGRPARNSLLSATVVAATCALADAYATAFMVMGVDSAKVLLSRHQELEAFLIFSERQHLRAYATPQFKKWLIQNNIKSPVGTECW
jgi:thiamine biosynthesis lipoprotein